LKSPDTPKIFLDVRNDADVLFGIHLCGTMDLQLLENFKNHHLQKHTRFVHGLAKSVREDSRMDPDEKRAREDSKEKGRCMFALERGGQYSIFDERPLIRAVVACCVQDVLCAPDLW
ncbi:hypothetical protein BKA61DRAFT_483248, partial [Leptodontidium sp. MPI-SDFR-AT-0119]